MTHLIYFLKSNYKEIVYQTVILIVLFVFFSFSKDYSEEISLYKLIALPKFAFFGNYLAAAMFVNYFLLPKLYYKKKEITFFVSLVLLVILVILVDEYVLEQIFFPDTRGTYFPGVLFTLLETLPIIFIMVGFKFVWDFNKKEGEINSLKTLVKENELQFLKSQINPHFLFNNLNTLYSYAIENSPHTATTILTLSSVLRYMLYDCREDFVPLSKEIKHLENFTALNELRIKHRGIFEFKTDVKSLEGTIIAPLILMVFIENAFKHSAYSQSDDILIQIHIAAGPEGLLKFTCKNNFLPAVKNDNNAKGIGLENVKKRLFLLYPETHELQINETDNRYEVKLNIQLKANGSC